jgi:dolichyl-diphosphooligosaccharide--protein glycosyltransferase
MKSVVLAARVFFVLIAGYWAYNIRLYAINTYGRVIHEFDPWFNYRATEYLHQHGLKEFFQWFDHRSWYPLGRPVGTTIYPGMQMTGVAIWHVLNEYLGITMSLNDICCFIPVWFGVSATWFLGLLTAECSGSSNAGVVGALIMSVIPAHIMRSVGGGYDNESIAVTAMVATFYFWCRSLRDQKSWPWGAVAGVAYIYMVAAWGGYVFVLNMVGVHAVGLVMLGRYSPNLHRSYTLFYFIGTLGAIQVPVVGMTPLKSLEQLGPCAAFLGFQLIEICERNRRKTGLSLIDALNPAKDKTYAAVFGIAGVAALAVIAALIPTGYFGPLSSRVRALFVKHTKTGNPLVDSVAEHQPASSQAYYQYMHLICYVAPIGWGLCWRKWSDSKFFLIFYGYIAYFFSSKMARLVILLGPVSSALGGIAIAKGLEYALTELQLATKEDLDCADPDPAAEAQAELEADYKKTDGDKAPKAGKKLKKPPKNPKNRKPKKNELDDMELPEGANKIISVTIMLVVVVAGRTFYGYSHRMAGYMSNPSIMYQARLQNGQTIIVDDYREAYWWLRDNTPEDARVMAWWDYGYQLAGIANRTTIADGNTWNHEHIATLGRCLTSPEKKGHQLIRHLADYMLIWTGGGGDDLAKSPHMARITTSVYPDHCPGDPICRKFGAGMQSGQPSDMMSASVLYKLHSHGLKAGVKADPKLFTPVFSSKYGKVRIWKVENVSKKSKKWNADPANRICDAPGSWYCEGQYPPALLKKLKKQGKQDFAQLEDFNSGSDAKKGEHYKQYMKSLGGGGDE